jgi:hypothetical protein
VVDLRRVRLAEAEVVRAQQRQSMWMALAGHHFAGAFSVALGAPAAHEAPVVPELPERVVSGVTARREWPT